MDEDVRDETWRKVTSVGNSWIVCKSRSHSGHVYYFNTFTGEAVWNLSDAEIEKAKSRTKSLEGQPGAKLTRCPEPKDHPPSLNVSVPAHVSLEEPIKVNSVSEEQQTALPFPSFANNDAIHSSINQISGMIQRSQINNLPSREDTIVKLNSLHNIISTFNLHPTPIYNPRVWDIPHAQPIYITPTINAVVSHPQPSLNNTFNNVSHTGPRPASGPFLNRLHKLSGNTMKGTRKFYPRHFNYGQGGQKNSNINNVFTNQKDLRQKLCAMKRFNNMPTSTPRASGVFSATPRRNDTSAHIASNPEEMYASDMHKSTLENRFTETPSHCSKIDVGPLKCLAPSDSNPDIWFIVVDLDILLNEFKFLNTLTDSDENCHLMVPRQVMSQLKDYVTCTENIQARRILRFLSQQIETGYAFMAEEPAEIKDASLAEVIHSTCIELSERKYHLILLTNDNEILGKSNSNIKMFSVNEIKNLLKDNPNKQQVSVPKQPFIFERHIKIIVPNDTPQKVNSSSTVKNIELDAHTEKIPVSESVTKQELAQDKTREPVVVKCTVDAGIQTDFEDINASISISNVTEKKDLETISNTPNAKEIIIRRTAFSVFNIPERRRAIKLKRNTSNQSTVVSVECNEKKLFKWRRRRNTTPQAKTPQTPIHSENKTHSKEIENLPSETSNKEINRQSDTILNKTPKTSRNDNKTVEDCIESRESSIICDNQRNSKENITIEETSTSGIISNTGSNVDAESVYSMSTNQLVDNEQTNAKPMYEIDSDMEDYLKMKCDEWVSRFIQVMEEVLSQVLQQDPPFLHSAMPAPWTLHEAAQCIAIKFSSHQDIKDAANSLSNILFQISDFKGKITINLAPYQYMQMYSYGVHLLSAITKVTNNCEDIQIAVESLKKLLEDIRNPNIDCGTNETFNDNLHDSSFNGEVSNDHDGGSFHEQGSLPVYNTTEEACKRRKLTKDEISTPIKFIRNIDVESSYFSTPHFQRVNEDLTKNNVIDETLVQSHQKQHSTYAQSEEDDSQNTSLSVEKATVTNITTDKPKIVRKFTICPEYEEKFKRQFSSNLYDDHDNELDYEEDYGEDLTEEYCSEDENDNVQCNDANENEIDVRDAIENCEPESENVVDPHLLNENSKKFKYMMGMLLQEIRKALCQVSNLCNQCYKELKCKAMSTVQKFELQQTAERARLHILRLCRSLQSMLEQETNQPCQNIRNLLKQADINICEVDDRLLIEYRITVGKCKDHADAFLNSIQNIISAFNNY